MIAVLRARALQARAARNHTCYSYYCRKAEALAKGLAGEEGLNEGSGSVESLFQDPSPPAPLPASGARGEGLETGSKGIPASHPRAHDLVPAVARLNTALFSLQSAHVPSPLSAGPTTVLKQQLIQNVLAGYRDQLLETEKRRLLESFR